MGKLPADELNKKAWTLGLGSALMIGLSAATNAEENENVKSKIKMAQVLTVVSWCTYPVVYLFPMVGVSPAKSVVGIQLGYCVSDIISKCGVGLMIYQISKAKSDLEK